MGAGPTGGGNGGNTGADAGFFISEQKKKEKINNSLVGGSDYQGDVNTPKPPKKKTPIVTPKDDALVEIGKGNITGAVKKIVKGPTIAEVDEATTDTTPTETAETTEANKKLKIKKKGRSASIMTSAKGVTKTSSDYSLGKKSLLGNV